MVDPALVARFKAALDRLNPGGGRIGLAVSGGPDSMAMLLLAQAAIPGGFEVATVNHGLRPEAKDECALVVAACEARGVPCEVLTVEVGAGNVQAKAREARYQALHDWAYDRDIEDIATAHHADDQAETILMRLNRGSGLSGLVGIREADFWSDDMPGMVILRPLLRFRRAELASVVESVGAPFVCDPGNRDESYDRVRIRKAIATADWLDPLSFVHSATLLQEAHDALSGLEFAFWLERVHGPRDNRRFRFTRHPSIDFRIVTKIIEAITKKPRGEGVSNLLHALRCGQSGNLAGVLATVEGDEWIFRPEPPRRTG